MNKQATVAVIASKTPKKPRINLIIVDIVLDIKREFGVDITYSKALHAYEGPLELNIETRIKT